MYVGFLLLSITQKYSEGWKLAVNFWGFEVHESGEEKEEISTNLSPRLIGTIIIHSCLIEWINLVEWIVNWNFLAVFFCKPVLSLEAWSQLWENFRDNTQGETQVRHSLIECHKHSLETTCIIHCLELDTNVVNIIDSISWVHWTDGGFNLGS